CPAAEGVAQSRPELWSSATARFRGPRTGDGSWSPNPKQWLPSEWHFAHEGKASFRLGLEALPSGQVGVFPEQRDNWDWIACEVKRANARRENATQIKVLNLFAYTGGSTLSAAVAGAEVVHVDAAHSVIDRARANAELSGLGGAPIRWI